MGKRLKMPKLLLLLPVLVLIFIAAVYFLIRKEPVYNFFFNYSFKTNLIVAVVVFLIFMLAFIVPRIFCNYICPVGLVGRFTLWLEKRYLK